jgi:hypothetical protein
MLVRPEGYQHFRNFSGTRGQVLGAFLSKDRFDGSVEGVLFALAASGGARSGFSFTFPCRPSHVGYAANRGHLETSVSESTTGTAPVFLRLHGFLHGARNGDCQ